jgi:uracil-DNA glycosylase family 4
MKRKFKSFDKEKRFEELCLAVSHCKLCPRLKDRKKVLSDENGNINSKIIFVAEAPGRLGADRTGVPLYGDKTGNNFERLLGNIGWSREEIFITNAILCNPREKNGNNDTPTLVEIKNCSPFLEMTIKLIQPDVVVSLGKIALTALKYIAPISIDLKKNVGKILPWAGRILVPLYHPGPRALIHRSLSNQRADFFRLSKFLHPRDGTKKTQASKYYVQQKLFDEISPSLIQQLTTEIINTLGKITYFKLTKLLYLIDLNSIKKLGGSITEEIYLRQDEGPWPPNLIKQIKELDNREIIFDYRRKVPMVEPGSSPRFQSKFDKDTLDVIFDVINKYGYMSNSEIKSATYLTDPMRCVIKQERQGKDMRNAPLIYKNKILGHFEPE